MMSTVEKVPMTAEGYDSLKRELERLKTVERPAVIRAIAQAREHGDLSENANIMPPANARVSLRPGHGIGSQSQPSPGY